MANTDLLRALDPLISRVRTDVSAIKLADGSRWTSEPLTPARLAAHISGKKPRGVCPIKAGESTTRVAVLDLDSHKGEVPWPAMTQAADNLLFALDLYGLRGIPWRSSGGRGIHIYLIWDEPQDAYSVRMQLVDVLASLGYENGAKGIGKHQVEVFPKQNEVGVGEFGNQFILPLAGLSEPLEPLTGLEPAGREYALHIEWPVSDPVPVREKPERVSAGVSTGEDLEQVRSALAAIPNEGEAELDYDAWYRVMCALHSLDAGGPESLALAHEFSARASKYQPAFLDDRVWPYIKAERENPVTIRTLYHMAGQHGWAPPPASAEEFELVPVGEGGKEAPALPPFVRDKQGRIEATIENVVKGIRTGALTGCRIGFDTFRDEVMIEFENLPGHWQTFSDAHYVELRMRLERRSFKPIGRELMRDAVAYVAAEHRFDSAIVWLEGLKWDGKPRVERFLRDYLGTEDTPYTRAVSRYLWTALAGRVLHPGVKADMVPILVGPQGAGKSTAVAALVPSVEFHAELDLASKEEDIARKLRGKLVGELGELRGMRTKEMEHIKQWVARTHEKWVPKFKEFETTFPRRLIFIGTTNAKEFLADETGERRWLPTTVGIIDRAAIERDRLQLWAEARDLFDAAGVDWREAEHLAKDVHGQHKLVDVWTQPIERWLDEGEEFDAEGVPPVPRREGRFTTADVLRGALGLEVRNHGTREEQRVCKILRALGFENRDRRVRGKVLKAWSALETADCGDLV